MTEKEKEYFFFRAPLSPGKKRKLLEQEDRIEVLFHMKEKELYSLGMTEKEVEKWEDLKKRERLWRSEYHSLSREGIQFITEKDTEYPSRLKALFDRPWGLLVKGRLPLDSLPSAAVIGSRNGTVYGQDMAKHTGRILSQAGVQVISGMALGADGAGHRGALSGWESGGAPTFAVLGCGCMRCYPPQNRFLYEKIPLAGGILSEYGPKDAPLAYHFPMRNRLIAALSDVVIVTEARKKSGSLITVDFALELGKEIYAFPGRITDSCSEGCNGLLQNGAGVITSLEELPALLGIHGRKKLKKEKLYEESELGLASRENLVYSCLDLEPKPEELIIEETGLKSQEVSAALLELELKGLVKRSDGNCYRKA